MNRESALEVYVFFSRQTPRLRVIPTFSNTLQTWARMNSWRQLLLTKHIFVIIVIVHNGQMNLNYTAVKYIGLTFYNGQVYFC